MSILVKCACKSAILISQVEEDEMVGQKVPALITHNQAAAAVVERCLSASNMFSFTFTVAS